MARVSCALRAFEAHLWFTWKVCEVCEMYLWNYVWNCEGIQSHSCTWIILDPSPWLLSHGNLHQIISLNHQISAFEVLTEFDWLSFVLCNFGNITRSAHAFPGLPNLMTGRPQRSAIMQVGNWLFEFVWFLQDDIPAAFGCLAQRQYSGPCKGHMMSHRSLCQGPLLPSFLVYFSIFLWCSAFVLQCTGF